MALIKADRVKETTTTTGTGSFTLDGAVAGYRAFSSVMATGDFCYYTAINPATNEWECGVGTFTAPSTLARSSIESSSNSGNAVNFGSGIKEVFLSVTANQVQVGKYPLSGSGTNTSIYLGHRVHANGIFGSNFTSNIMIGNQAFLDANKNFEVCFRNVGIGQNALQQIASDPAYPGSSNLNTAVGYFAGIGLLQGGNNVFIGAGARPVVDTCNYAVAIGASTFVNASNTINIGNPSFHYDCYIAGHLHPSGAVRPASIADASAPNNAIYYSTTAGKLVYKDASGTVNNLY